MNVNPLAALAAFALTLLTAAANAQPRPAQRTTLRAGAPTWDHAAVGLLVGQSSTGLGSTCTGTLVGPAVVLTAAHCATHFAADPGATLRFVVTRREGRQYSYDVIDAETWGGEHTPSTRDVALLRLARPVRGVAPVALTPWMPRIDGEVTAVGFGSDDPACREALDEEVGDDDAPCQETFVKRELTFRWGERARQGELEPGDSGGPVIWNGAVVAVASGHQTTGAEQQDIWADAWSFVGEFREVLTAWFGEEHGVELGDEGGDRPAERVAAVGTRRSRPAPSPEANGR